MPESRGAARLNDRGRCSCTFRFQLAARRENRLGLWKAPALDEFLQLERCPADFVAVRSQTICLMAVPEKSINAN
jgi:hypothetical protein